MEQHPVKKTHLLSQIEISQVELLQKSLLFYYIFSSAKQRFLTPKINSLGEYQFQLEHHNLTANKGSNTINLTNKIVRINIKTSTKTKRIRMNGKFETYPKLLRRRQRTR